MTRVIESSGSSKAVVYGALLENNECETFNSYLTDFDLIFATVFTSIYNILTLILQGFIYKMVWLIFWERLIQLCCCLPSGQDHSFDLARAEPTCTIRNLQVSIMYMTVGLCFVVLELDNVNVKQELAPWNQLNSLFSDCNFRPFQANPVLVSSFDLIHDNSVVFAAV